MASSDTQKQTQLLIDTNEKILSNVKVQEFFTARSEFKSIKQKTVKLKSQDVNCCVLHYQNSSLIGS